ncbi:MAG: FkbM family methyltransferase [Candidatus Aenigmarchaeota archaeon]|nr:FkbM family methyltransferase [Candidatus Aenigmarchaeota archaeon]
MKLGSVFVDIGAHVGYFTLRAAKLVGPSGRVYAFEPAPQNHELLQKNVKINNYKNVMIEKACITSKTGSTDFFLSGDSGTHSTKFKSSKKMRVKCFRLDDFCNKNRVKKIDLIKIDVKGGEYEAFRGMKNIIRRNKNIRLIAEFVPSYVRKAGTTPKEFIEMIKSMGFKKFLSYN